MNANINVVLPFNRRFEGDACRSALRTLRRAPQPGRYVAG